MTRGRRTVTTVATTLSLMGTQAMRQGPDAAEAFRGRQQLQTTSTVSASPESTSTSLEEADRLQQSSEIDANARHFDEAVEKVERALAIRRQHLGEMHPDVAVLIASLGDFAYQQGQYERAEMRYREALSIRETALGPDHLDVAESLIGLASMLLLEGDYVRPEPLYQRALEIYKRTASARKSPPGDDLQSLTAGVLNNLALLFHRRGDYARAESQYLQALAIRERTLGPHDPAVGKTLADLGAVYYASEQYDKAMHVLQRALGILPPNHPSLATCTFNLAAVYFNRGTYQSAEMFFRRALAIDERALGAQHPTLAIRLLGLAEVLRLEGQYADAAPLYERAFATAERALGSGHPQVAATLVAWARLRYATGDFDGATDLLSRGSALREETLTHVLTTGAEEEKRLYLRTLVDETDFAISLHLGSAPGSAPAARLALTDILQRKGRSIDAATDEMATIRARFNDTDREVINQFSAARSRLAKAVLGGLASGAQEQTLTALRSEVNRLEQTIGARSRDFPVPFEAATLKDIQERLPAGTALIEFVSYRPFLVRNARDRAFAAPRYAVYVLRNDGIATSVDLGNAQVIDRHVERFRAALSNPADQQVRVSARALYLSLMAPVQEALRDVTRLIISPDGALNLIPFAALVGADGKYLVDHVTISYMTSGRDLARLRDVPPDVRRAASPPVVVANPLFDTPGARSPAARSVTAPAAASSLQFSPLPGTALEASSLKTVLPDADVYTGASATEALLKQLTGPSILHIATHGFFLRPPSAPLRRWPVKSQQEALPLDRQEALVLSGLALAGANQRSSGGGEDGILTALEVAGLDLRGTRMVVLSACETAVGDARNGEGVYGLRRALVLAGSESQVMSLWRIDDSATRDLMIGFYQRLRVGEGRADALRNIQLALLHGRQNRSHPFYWASFIQSGDWRKVFD